MRDDAVHIIGAGLIGLSTADSLMERGRDVVIWDRAPAPGMGASFMNSAMLHPSQAAPWMVEGANDGIDEASREALTREGLDLARRSGERIARRMDELGLPPVERGLLQIFDDIEQRDARLESYARLGVRAEPTSWLGHAAIDIPEDSLADARAYTLRLAEDLVSRGADMRMGRDIHLTLRGGRQLCIESQGEEDTCTDAVIVAAGHRSGELLRQVGVEMDVQAVPGHALRFGKPDGIDMRAIMHATSRTALTILDDEIRISGSVGLDSPDDLLPVWGQLSPGLIKRLGEPVARWTGYRPTIPNGRPMMGRTAIDGLYVNTGHAHMGWSLSAGAGEIVADAVMEGAATPAVA